MALFPKRERAPALDEQARRKAAEEEVLMREIDEAVREDQLNEAAKRYGVPALAVVLLGLMGFGGYLWWHGAQEKAMEVSSEQLIAALDQLEAGHHDTANTSLAPIASDGGPGAASIARLVQAGIALDGKRKEEAIRLYEQVANDKAAPKPYRELATLRAVAAGFDTMKPEDIIARLKPLATPGNAWFGSAGELVAMAYLKQGKKDLAGPLFAEVAKADNVPETLQTRARQMAGLLGVDAVADVDAIAAGGGELLPGQQAAPIDISAQ